MLASLALAPVSVWPLAGMMVASCSYSATALGLLRLDRLMEEIGRDAGVDLRLLYPLVVGDPLDAAHELDSVNKVRLLEEKFGRSFAAKVVPGACLGLAAALEGRCRSRGSDWRDGAASGALLGLGL